MQKAIEDEKWFQELLIYKNKTNLTQLMQDIAKNLIKQRASSREEMIDHSINFLEKSLKARSLGNFILINFLLTF